MGISPELLPQVFEHGISGEKGGMGFGLAICREIVQAHGRELRIESGELRISSCGELEKNTAFVDGTTVSFTMPVYGIEN